MMGNPEESVGATNQSGRDALGPSDASEPQHNPWHSRGYLPHFDCPGRIQSITFRLFDSVPVKQIARWKVELDWHEGMPASDPVVIKLRRLLAAYEDAGHGGCSLRDARIARTVRDALRFFDGERYRLLAFCVMPNHVHTLLETIDGHPVSEVMHSWKSFTSKEANKILKAQGEFWFPDYYDRFVRDETHLSNARRYIVLNPVKAGLVRDPGDWPWTWCAEGGATGSAGVPPASTQIEDQTSRSRRPNGTKD